MLTYLYGNSHGDNPRDQQAFITAADMLRGAYLPPAARSALFRAMARIPGVRAMPDVVDVAGRHGVAVTRTYGYRQELIFDPKTYEYLGEQETVVADPGTGGPGTTPGRSPGHTASQVPDLPLGMVFGRIAILRVAIVDRAGQVP